MPIYVYIDDSGKLDSVNKKNKLDNENKRYQNYTAIVFTDLKTKNQFEKDFRSVHTSIIKQNPELVENSDGEIKGSKLWSNIKHETYQDLLLGTLKGKGRYTGVFSQGVYLINFEENYWKNADSCTKIWTDMKKWLIEDLVIKYYNRDLISRWYDKFKEKVLIEVFIDNETTKSKFKEEIKKILEETTNKKIKIVARTDLDSKKYPGIQMADIVANVMQRHYIETGNINEFKKYFKKKTNCKISISKTWKKIKTPNQKTD